MVARRVARCRPTPALNWYGAIPPSWGSCQNLLEGLVPARAWGFKSPLRHHSVGSNPAIGVSSEI